MTIGRNSARSSTRSSIRTPKFLDKSSGFYGRLDEPETSGEGEEVRANEAEERGNGTREGRAAPGVADYPRTADREDAEAFDFSEGMMEDDGETLLRRKPSRLSSRWRRSSRRKQKDGRTAEDTARDERPGLDAESPVEPDALVDTRVMIEVELERLKKVEEEEEKTGRGKAPALVHFPAREDEDDEVLIRDKKRGREEEEEEEEGEEERRMRKEQKEGMKVVKRNTVKNYRKALDRAFRRGWEVFVANLYSVTLAPVTSSSPASPSSKKNPQRTSVLAEFQ